MGIAGGWLLGLFLGAQLRMDASPLFVATALLGALALALHGGGLRSRLWVIPLSSLALWAGLGVQPASRAPCWVSGELRGTAHVESVRYGPEDARLELRFEDVAVTGSALRVPNGQAARARLPLDAAPHVGDRVSLDAEVRPRTELQNPSPHPRLWARRGARCWVALREPSDLRVIMEGSPRRALSELRARVRRHLIAALPDDVAAVSRALVLGDGGALGHERRKTIAAVGLAHLFAVSGLHVALVSGTLVASLRWWLRGAAVAFDARRLAAALGVPLALLHATFAGGSPSAWRAAITAAIAWGLVAVGRRPSPAAVTGAAALVLSVPDPSIALRPGFLLSIVATSAILSGPRLPSGARWRRIRGLATISARTLVATAPMVWWWFGGVPLVGWLANIVVLPLGSWVVIPLAHLFGMSAWIPGIAAPLGAVLVVAVRALLTLCDLLAHVAWSSPLPPLDVAQGLVLLTSCIALLASSTWRQRALVVLMGALLGGAAEAALRARERPESRLRVTFVDVGQGDAALIDLPDGRAALIDTGQGGRHPAVCELTGLLAARRRSRIDLVVVTHGHPDHYGGLEDLLARVDIGEIWLNGQLLTETPDGGFEALLNAALRRGTKLRFTSELCETSSDFGGARFEVLWPCPRYDPALDLNDNSLTLRIRYGRRSFLFTGDLEAAAEERLLERGAIEPVDVLKVAHHGSRTSTTAPFVAAAAPSLAVVSSGAGNRYGHPSADVLARLRASGATLHRTDLQGGLIVVTDGERLRLLR